MACALPMEFGCLPMSMFGCEFHHDADGFASCRSLGACATVRSCTAALPCFLMVQQGSDPEGAPLTQSMPDARVRCH